MVESNTAIILETWIFPGILVTVRLGLIIFWLPMFCSMFLFEENPSEPFGASVIIDGVTYGAGTASSKKLAKNKAGNVNLFK